MKTHHHSAPPLSSFIRSWFRRIPLRLAGLGVFFVTVVVLFAQSPPEFLALQRLTNGEVLVRLNAAAGLNYRIDASSEPSAWQSLLSLQSTGINSYVDSGSPFAGTRFYRAEQLAATNVFTGDHLSTTNGDVVFHPINHASVVFSWNGKVFYNDPVGGAAPYVGLPRADVILISHVHGDHFNSQTLDAVRGSNCVMLAPRQVYDGMSVAQRGITQVLNNGMSTNFLGVTVAAIPAYNGNHPLGTGNGYVVSIGGKHIYFSGDTGNTPEMRALRDVDVAFLCMNVPFTMTVNDATNAVRAFRPRVVYPYHYRDQNGATTNAANFKRLLGLDPGVEVRLRKWY